MADEIIFYEKEGVKITNTRAILNNKTYAMANITSVSVGKKPAKNGWGIFLLIVGIGLLASLSSPTATDKSSLIVWTFIILGGAIYILLNAKPTYIVRIGSSSGEGDALFSSKNAYIQEIVDALNDAIIKRG